LTEGMAITVKIVPIAITMSSSTNENPLEFPRSLVVVLLAALFRSARIISNILACLGSGWLQTEPAPVASLSFLREVPTWIEQLPGQALNDIQVPLNEYVREYLGEGEIPSAAGHG
jgi:hypothetical protein